MDVVPTVPVRILLSARSRELAATAGDLQQLKKRYIVFLASSEPQEVLA